MASTWCRISSIHSMSSSARSLLKPIPGKATFFSKGNRKHCRPEQSMPRLPHVPESSGLFARQEHGNACQTSGGCSTGQSHQVTNCPLNGGLEGSPLKLPSTASCFDHLGSGTATCNSSLRRSIYPLLCFKLPPFSPAGRPDTSRKESHIPGACTRLDPDTFRQAR